MLDVFQCHINSNFHIRLTWGAPPSQILTNLITNVIGCQCRQETGKIPKHTDSERLKIPKTDYTSVDAKHLGASLSEQWNVTWVGNNSVCTH